MKGRFGVLGAAGLLGLFSVHCGGSSGSSGSSGEDVATTSEAVTTYDHCYAQIERPLPSDATLPIGTQLTLRANPNLICPPGVTETLVYRFYIQGQGQQFALQADGTWTSSRESTFDTHVLVPGKYRMYLYSLPAQYLADWTAGADYARALAHRSGYTYTTFADTSWQISDWSTCSVACGGGTQTRTATCVDQSGVEADGQCGASPATSQVCNEVACPTDAIVVNDNAYSFTVTDYAPSGGWQIYSASSSGYYFLADFPEKPTSAADYSPFDDTNTWPIPASHAALMIFSADGSLVWSTESTSAPIHVQTGVDSRLHIVFQDVALPSTTGQPAISVALDVGFD